MAPIRYAFINVLLTTRSDKYYIDRKISKLYMTSEISEVGNEILKITGNVGLFGLIVNGLFAQEFKKVVTKEDFDKYKNETKSMFTEHKNEILEIKKNMVTKEEFKEFKEEFKSYKKEVKEEFANVKKEFAEIKNNMVTKDELKREFKEFKNDFTRDIEKIIADNNKILLEAIKDGDRKILEKVDKEYAKKPTIRMW